MLYYPPHSHLPGLYIHVPFCRSKCPYCGFYSIASEKLIPRWVNALKKEAVYYKNRFGRFDSLYLGGGTPSLLDTGILSDMVEYLFSCFDFMADSEITIEANPSDLSPEKARALRQIGFNRISLGVQSFCDRNLRFLGRTHSARQAQEALTLVKSCGFNNISMDLIYGFDGQSLTDWMGTLSKAVSFGPAHFSCYQLTLEEKTPLFRLKERGLYHPLDDVMESSFFITTSRFLKDNGYTHYEISSFAENDSSISKHNMKYWLHSPYLGLGPSAHSFDGSQQRWWNVSSVRRYCEALEEGASPVSGSECLSDEQLAFERVVLGLRTKDGLDENVIPLNHRSWNLMSELRDSGFIVIDNGRIMPTTKGFLMADYLACALSGPV
ncbi:putative oxygen-independent coproporphyrinogen III oxidase [uncultured Desulfobacterium sp.]|uniref:Heme chaperone HemW n=1 Tax=uncultured Desulfobacterium sp. TaxID=201089 RepID=A0A445N0B6_9BACT|nr:putative oxygen-independent coproporphyrinogen III oxidase [uncultured Desulfobacterium sp.]